MPIKIGHAKAATLSRNLAKSILRLYLDPRIRRSEQKSDELNRGCHALPEAVWFRYIVTGSKNRK